MEKREELQRLYIDKRVQATVFLYKGAGSGLGAIPCGTLFLLLTVEAIHRDLRSCSASGIQPSKQ